MGIRDEIEKLIQVGERQHCCRGYDELVSRHDVLSILDKWECVGEGPLEYVLGQDYAGHRIGETWVHTLLIGLKKGDHIIILRKRNESSS